MKESKIQINNYLPGLDIEKIQEEIFEGLTGQKKYISSKFFYDELGSNLFEKITQLPEYYPARTEKQILKTIDWVFSENPENLNIYELGSGDHSKISLIIKRIPEKYRRTLTYMPVDISASAVEQSANNLHHIFPEIQIQGFVADFIHQLDFIPDNKNRLFCFLGSTIGNFTESLRFEFMQKVNQIMKSGEHFLVGFDTVKDPQILEAAYNDTQKVTESFNLNILKVVNGLCETNFITTDFRHIAFYNKQENRIEMHLEAVKNMKVTSRYFPESIQIKQGERIHTENSHKFDAEKISQIANRSGFQIKKIFNDNNNWFNLVLLQKA
ncbi:MAG: L-histidine N(alpha)-methyltransferase [Bacteroidales bacterium]